MEKTERPVSGKTGPGGFTFIELMLAIVVLTVGIFALISILIPTAQLEQTAREQDLAKNAAVSKLEEIRGFNYNAITGTYTNQYFPVMGLTAPAGYTNVGNVTIDASNPNLLDITVTITWKTATLPNTNLSVVMKRMMTRSSGS